MPLRGRGRRWAEQHPHHLKDVYSLVIRDQTGQYLRITFKLDLTKINRILIRLFHSREGETQIGEGLFQIRIKRVYPRPGRKEQSPDAKDYQDEQPGPPGADRVEEERTPPPQPPG